jgi:D-3-phosphoglycerate dehydrogenase
MFVPESCLNGCKRDLSTLKVFVPEPEEPETLAVLREIADVKMGEPGRAWSEQDFAREMADTNVVIITSQYKVTRNIIARAPRLLGIVKYGSRPGLDNVDISAANERKIKVSYTRGANSESVAEFTIALVFALAKKLHTTMPLIKNNQWRITSCFGLELLQKTVGIIGLGAVGRKVATKLNCLGMQVLATDPFVSSDTAEGVHARLTDLRTLLSQSDVVSVHAQVTDDNKRMIGRRELALMKPTAYFVNTARGVLVDEMALYEALRDGKIAGAAMDVFETEPPLDSPFLSLDNVIMTPHIASWTPDALRKEASVAVEEARRMLLGLRPTNLINPEVMSSPTAGPNDRASAGTV